MMEVLPKPQCYDSVPPCLCQKCQRYDVYMTSCVPRTFGETTRGLSVVNAARSNYADVHSRSVRRKPARSRPRCSVVPPVTSSSVAPPVTSSSVALPVTSSPVAVSTVVSSFSSFGSRTRAVAATSSSVCSSPVAVSTAVSSFAPFGSRARVSTVAASSSSVASHPVAVSSVVPSPVAVPAVVSSSSFVGVSSSVVVSRPFPSGSLACPVSVSPVCPSPCVVPPAKFGGVSLGPASSGSTVPRLSETACSVVCWLVYCFAFWSSCWLPVCSCGLFCLGHYSCFVVFAFWFRLVVFASLALKFWLARFFQFWVLVWSSAFWWRTYFIR